MFRLVLQSALLGVGAYLTIHGELTAGAIIACSIAGSRAYAPIETAIANWKGFVAARQSAARLRAAAEQPAAAGECIELPPPVNTLAVEAVGLAAPGSQRAILTGVAFQLRAGQALAVIGQSAAGKSTLARALVGSGRSRGAPSASTAPISVTGPWSGSAATSATCRRTSSSSTARSPTTSPASRRRPTAGR